MATPSVPAGYKLVADDNQAPEARGKAAAMSAYLARKGSPKKGRRLDRHVAKFETMWAQAPDKIKEKYAGRSQKTDLAPSERPDLAPIPRPTNASLNAAKPGESPSQTQERQRLARGGKPVAAKPAPGNAFADLTKAPATPAGGAKPVTADTNGDGLQNNDDGMATNQLPVDKNNQPIIPKGNQGLTPTQQAQLTREKNGQQSNTPQRPVDQVGSNTNPTGRTSLVADVKNGPSATPTETPPPVPGPKEQAKSPTMTMTEAFSANDANPFVNIDPAVDAVRDQAKNQAQSAINTKRAADEQARNRINNERANSEASRLGVTPPAAGAPPSAPAAGQPPYRPIGSRAEDIAAAGGDPTKLPTDSRMVVQDKVNGGSTPVNKAPVDLSARTSSTQPPVAGPKAVADAKIGEAPPGMELIGTGWKRDAAGNKTNEREPKYAPKSAPVAVTPAMRAGAQSVMERDGVVPMSRSAPPMPRGPASQPERTGSSVPPIASPKQIADDPDILRKDNVAWANAQSGLSGGNPNDADHETAKNAQKKLYDGANEMDKIRLGNQSLKRSAGLLKDLDTEVQNAPRASNPANTRVTARRPATPEELKTGKVMPPVRRP